ncbi:hypothetical protein LCM20_01745 [Halobacillus litoralis]|uniref:hypothetical protein n=1 Tax=Halobacillus litoralis TaxID=45668 RepID=UPI001CD3A402|nr:hypothetical protein [Halobacillus litoralis]MCA0969310.1 hypothetical protein [Halobacillus litoralis]
MGTIITLSALLLSLLVIFSKLDNLSNRLAEKQEEQNELLREVKELLDKEER